MSNRFLLMRRRYTGMPVPPCLQVRSRQRCLPARKILMHLAVEKGAPAGKSFLEYVKYLAQKGYVPPNGYGWVDHIRTKGNEANHEIKVMGEAEAKDLITFTEMLLKIRLRISRQGDATGHNCELCSR